MNNLATLLTDNNIELYPNFEGYRLSNKSPQVYEFPLKNGKYLKKIILIK